MRQSAATTTAALVCLILCNAACQRPSEGPRAQSSSAPPAERASDRTIGWSQLKTGMDHIEVLSLLDEPAHVKVTKVNTTWYYSDRRADGPLVVFDTRRMRVERWRAP